MEAQRREVSKPQAGQSRIATVVERADELVGAHPDALASIFEHARPADPEAIGDAPRGVLLAIVAAAPVHLAARPLVRGLSRAARPVWRGVAFDHGGNSGTNVLALGRALRFRCERAPSKLDGRPALVLTYERSPWPLSLLRDELRAATSSIALGATFVGDRLTAWFALSRE